MGPNPTLEERAEIFRTRLTEWGYDLTSYSDKHLQEILTDADNWVGEMRYSATIVAKHIIMDGYPHG